MNGESTDPIAWMTMFPSLFGDGASATVRGWAEAVLAVALEVAERGEAVRSQVRGAIVEELTARLLERRVGADLELGPVQHTEGRELGIDPGDLRRLIVDA